MPSRKRRTARKPWRERCSGFATDVAGQTPFQLGFVDLCDMGNVTEGEVRWMAHVILEQRPDWFARRC